MYKCVVMYQRFAEMLTVDISSGGSHRYEWIRLGFAQRALWKQPLTMIESNLHLQHCDPATANKKMKQDRGKGGKAEIKRDRSTSRVYFHLDTSQIFPSTFMPIKHVELET